MYLEDGTGKKTVNERVIAERKRKLTIEGLGMEEKEQSTWGKISVGLR